MIFALPIIGKVLAGFAASEASAGVASAQKSGKTVGQSGAAADPADFAVTLDNLDQSAAAKAAHRGPFDAAKV